MKENIMTVATTYEDRLALIKTIAERRKRMAMVRKQSAKVMATVKPKKAEIDIPEESNIYAWTDASRYAKEYYGDTLYHTTKFDNDWD
jgi:mRNA degradation ribonuclease J1/J2